MAKWQNSSLKCVACCLAFIFVMGALVSAQSEASQAQIVYVSSYFGPMNIFIMNADGGNPQRLTEGNGDSLNPACSQDGNFIAFDYDDFMFSTELIVIDRFVTTAAFLTRDEPSHNYQPTWSPDASQLAFISYIGGGDSDLYIMNAGGTERRQILDTDIAESDPAWSPDGSKIAFVSILRPHPGEFNPEIYLINPDGSNLVRLTNNNARDEQITWSPDAAQLAFSSDRDGNAEIYTMNANGSNVVRLTNNDAYDGFPAWSPDGSRIAFTSKRDGNLEIYTMNVDGSGVHRLTNDSADDWLPCWLIVPVSPTPTLTPSHKPT